MRTVEHRAQGHRRSRGKTLTHRRRPTGPSVRGYRACRCGQPALPVRAGIMLRTYVLFATTVCRNRDAAPVLARRRAPFSRGRRGSGLGDHAHVEDGIDARHQAHVDLVVAESLDRLAKVERVAVQLDPLAVHEVPDLVAGHGSEETAALTGLDRDLQ